MELKLLNMCILHLMTNIKDPKNEAMMFKIMDELEGNTELMKKLKITNARKSVVMEDK